MAAKYAVIKMPETVVLPLADALKLFELLADAEQLSRDYGDRECEFKPAKYKVETTLKHMTIAQYAAVQLKDAG